MSSVTQTECDQCGTRTEDKNWTKHDWYCLEVPHPKEDTNSICWQDFCSLDCLVAFIETLKNKD